MTDDAFEQELIRAMTEPIDDSVPLVVNGPPSVLSSIRAVQASALTTDKIHLPASSLSRVSPKTRERAAEAGEAMKDGSFPIRDQADLRRAIKAFGRAKDKAAAKRHIIRRARALKRGDLLPEAWRPLAAKAFPGEESLTAAPRPSQNAVLVSKAERHNAIHPVSRQVRAAKLACVYSRGLADYDGRPGVTPEQFAQARVNAFLRLLSAGAPDSPSYTQDDDLLPASHPVRG